MSLARLMHEASHRLVLDRKVDRWTAGHGLNSVTSTQSIWTISVTARSIKHGDDHGRQAVRRSNCAPRMEQRVLRNKADARFGPQCADRPDGTGNWPGLPQVAGRRERHPGSALTFSYRNVRFGLAAKRPDHICDQRDSSTDRGGHASLHPSGGSITQPGFDSVWTDAEVLSLGGKHPTHHQYDQ